MSAAATATRVDAEPVSQNTRRSEYRQSLRCGKDWLDGKVHAPEWMGEYEDYFQWGPGEKALGWLVRYPALRGELGRRGEGMQGLGERLGYKSSRSAYSVLVGRRELSHRAGRQLVEWLREGAAPVEVPLDEMEHADLARGEEWRQEQQRLQSARQGSEAIEQGDGHPPTKTSSKSEAVSKKRRGRPRKWVVSEAEEKIYEAAGVFLEVKTRRGRQDVIYRQRAIEVLGDGFPWLWDKKRCLAGEKAWKPIILAELGRIEDEGHLREIARQVCELQPRSKEAVQLIRRWRVGVRPGDASQLWKELANGIDDYRKRFPEFTFEEVAEVLEQLLDRAQGLCDE